MGGEIVSPHPFPLFPRNFPPGIWNGALAVLSNRARSYWGCSRPRQVKDVAHQEEVIRVLTNTLQTADVSKR